MHLKTFFLPIGVTFALPAAQPSQPHIAVRDDFIEKFNLLKNEAGDCDAGDKACIIAKKFKNSWIWNSNREVTKENNYQAKYLENLAQKAMREENDGKRVATNEMRELLRNWKVVRAQEKREGKKYEDVEGIKADLADDLDFEITDEDLEAVLEFLALAPPVTETPAPEPPATGTCDIQEGDDDDTIHMKNNCEKGFYGAYAGILTLDESSECYCDCDAHDRQSGSWVYDYFWVMEARHGQCAYNSYRTY